MVTRPRQRMESFIEKSFDELSQFQRTKNLDYLAQASEKLWAAYTHLLEEVSGRSLKSFTVVRNMVLKLSTKYRDDLFYEVFTKAYALHQFFYRGWTEYPEAEDIVSKIYSVEGGIRALERRYLKK